MRQLPARSTGTNSTQNRPPEQRRKLPGEPRSLTGTTAKPKAMTQEEATRASQIREVIGRLLRTRVTLKTSAIKEVRLMIGSVTPIIVCDAIYPIAEIKKGYARAIRYRILELQNELEELSN